MPPIRSAVFDRLRKPYERSTLKREERHDGKWVHDRAPEGTPISNRLEITNLHWEVTEQDLSTIFSTIGTLVSKPHIRVRNTLPGDAFDRSGRSTGIAYVEFTSPAEAIRAKNQLDGKVAKTQAMAIKFASPRIPPGVRAATKSDSLLNRVAKPALLSRISTGNKGIKKSGIPVGPMRNRQPRGAGAGAGAASRPPKKDKTAEELDKELDAFMGTTEKENTTDDIEMS